jgi:hypothetical protein
LAIDSVSMSGIPATDKRTHTAMERLYEPPQHHNGSAPPPDTSQTRMQRMLAEMEAWKDATIEALKIRHAATHRDQLRLFEPLEGLNMQKVFDAMIKLNAIEEVIASVNLTRNAIYSLLREEGLPDKCVRNALKIARSSAKVDDATPAVLERCVKLAMLLQEEEEPA